MARLHGGRGIWPNRGRAPTTYKNSLKTYGSETDCHEGGAAISVFEFCQLLVLKRFWSNGFGGDSFRTVGRKFTGTCRRHPSVYMAPVCSSVFGLGLATRRRALVIAMVVTGLLRVRRAVGVGGVIALASHVYYMSSTVVVVCSSYSFRLDLCWDHVH